MCAQKCCGCCKPKKKTVKTFKQIDVQSKPRPKPEISVESPVRHEMNVSRVERGEPKVTYGEKIVVEHREQVPAHLERRHVQTRQLSPDRNADHVVIYNQDIDWAKESRANYEVGHVHHVAPQNHVVYDSNRVPAGQGYGSRVVHGDSRVVQGDARVVSHNSRVVQGGSRVHEVYNPYSN